MEHYRAELEKRGTVWEDLERLKKAQDGSTQDLPRKGLPGLVPQYADEDDLTCSYKRAVFMSQDADWDPEHNGRKLCLVEFDPISQHFEPDEKIYFDPMSTLFILSGWMLLKALLRGLRILADLTAQTSF